MYSAVITASFLLHRRSDFKVASRLTLIVGIISNSSSLPFVGIVAHSLRINLKNRIF